MNVFTKRIAFALMLIPFISGCKGLKESKEEENIKAIIPVNCANVNQESLTVYQTLNGVIQYQKRDKIRSNTTGYISELDFIQGNSIKKGDLFCTINTKEQNALSGSIQKDTTLSKFSKPIPIYCNSTGIISSVSIVQGDYVAEGDALASVLDPNSMVVVVFVPFEYHNSISKGVLCEINLPDGKKINMPITGMIPTVDSVSQSQKYFIKVNNILLPEKLNVTVRFPMDQASNAVCVPLSAVQTDEQQKEFWVMKIVHDTLAVKVPVTIGLRTDSTAQISSSGIKLNDLVVTNGSYQLEDSSTVKINKR